MYSRIKTSLKKYIPNTTLVFIYNVKGKPFSFILKKLINVLISPFKNKIYSNKLIKIERSKQLPNDILYNAFKGSTDDFWFWLFTKGSHYRNSLNEAFPFMPEENLQLQFTGVSGYQALEEAFLFYKLINRELKRLGAVINEKSRILDFGCGWGRIIRFFLRDVPANNLFGYDCDEEIIKICRDLNFNCNFYVNNIFPPTESSDNYFDLIFSFSVFSHLSEEAHKLWLSEFKRILKPGGVLVVTTRSREFIISCARLRENSITDIPFFSKGPANSFLDTSKSLMDYDDGKFVYEPVGGGGMREGSFYGETCIPEGYVSREWKNYFNKLNFINYNTHRHFNQNTIIAQK